MSFTVYYLDDEPELCELFVEIYQTEGTTITSFTSPADFTRVANQSPPDLAFIDFRLPGTTGELVAAALRVEFPKYLVTGEVQVNASKLFVGVLSKPVSVHEVQEILDRYRK